MRVECLFPFYRCHTRVSTLYSRVAGSLRNLKDLHDPNGLATPPHPVTVDSFGLEQSVILLHAYA